MQASQSFFQKLSDSITTFLPFTSNSKNITNQGPGYVDKNVCPISKSNNRRLASEAFNMDENEVKVKRAKLHHNPMLFPSSRIIKTPISNDIGEKLTTYNNFNDTASVLSEASSVSVSTSGVSSLHPRSNKRFNLGSNLRNIPENPHVTIKYPRNLNLSYQSGHSMGSSMKSLKESSSNNYISSNARKILEKLNTLTTPISPMERYSVSTPYQRPVQNLPKIGKNPCPRKAVIVAAKQTENVSFGPIRRKTNNSIGIGNSILFDHNKEIKYDAIPRFEDSLISKKLNFSNLPLLKKSQSTDTTDLCDLSQNKRSESPPLTFSFRQPRLVEDEIYDVGVNRSLLLSEEQLKESNVDKKIEFQISIKSKSDEENVQEIKKHSKIVENEKHGIEYQSQNFSFGSTLGNSSLKPINTAPLIDLDNVTNFTKICSEEKDVSVSSKQNESISLSNVVASNSSIAQISASIKSHLEKTVESTNANNDNLSQPFKFHKIEPDKASGFPVTKTSSSVTGGHSGTVTSDKNQSLVDSGTKSIGSIFGFVSTSVSQEYSNTTVKPSPFVAEEVSSSLFMTNTSTNVSKSNSIFSTKEPTMSNIFATKPSNPIDVPNNITSLKVSEPSGSSELKLRELSSDKSGSVSIDKSINLFATNILNTASEEPKSVFGVACTPQVSTSACIFPSNGIQPSSFIFGSSNSSGTISSPVANVAAISSFGGQLSENQKCTTVSSASSSAVFSSIGGQSSSSQTNNLFAFGKSCTSTSFGSAVTSSFGVQSSISQASNLFGFGQTTCSTSSISTPISNISSVEQTLGGQSNSIFSFGQVNSSTVSSSFGGQGSSNQTASLFGFGQTGTSADSNSVPVVMNSFGGQTSANQTSSLFSFGQAGASTSSIFNGGVPKIDNLSSSVPPFQFGQTLNSETNSAPNLKPGFKFGDNGKESENSEKFPVDIVKTPSIDTKSNQAAPFKFGTIGKVEQKSSFQFGSGASPAINFNSNQTAAFNFGGSNGTVAGSVPENSAPFQFGVKKQSEIDSNSNQGTAFAFGAGQNVGGGAAVNMFSSAAGQSNSNQRRLLKVRRNRK